MADLPPAEESRSLRLTELVLPLGVGAVLRLLLVVSFIGTVGAGDEAQYLRLGWGWHEFEVYTGMWAPLYPGLISCLTAMFGEGAADAVRFVQIGLAVWTGVWTALMANMFGGRKAALIAAWGYALYLPLAGFTALLYSESLFLAFFVPALYQLLRYAREGRGAAPVWRGPLAGLALGLSVLTRESTLIVIPPLMAWVALAVRPQPYEPCRARTNLSIAPALLFGLTAILTIMPWTIRNAHLFNRLVPVATSANGSALIGLNAYDINYDIADLGPSLVDAPGRLRDMIRGPEPEPWAPRKVKNAADATSYNLHDGAAFAAKHPQFFLRSRVVELIDLLSPHSYILRAIRITDGVGAPLSNVYIRSLFSLLAVLLVPLVLLLGLGGWAFARDAGPLRSLAANLAVCTGAVSIISGLTRYRAPIMPMVIVLGSLYLAGCREVPSPRRRVTAAILAVGLILAWIPSIEPTRIALSTIWGS